jgi:LysR family transcriptional regulator, regulator for bpeEF and oprC
MSTFDPDLFAGIVPFVATADVRSFRAAAKQLGVTPSAVSKSISRLEAELGVKLLSRTSRTVTVTPEGDAFLRRCREAVDQVRAAREVATQAVRAPRGLLRVSLPLPLGRLVVMPALPRLLTRHPGLSIEAVMTDRIVRLLEENVDVVVRIGAIKDSQSVVRRLRPARSLTVASPAYLARHGTPVRPEDLVGHNCLKYLSASGTPREWTFTVGSREITVSTPGNLVADYGEAIVEAAVAGLGVVQAMEFMVAHHLASGALIELLRGHEPPAMPVVALSAPGRHKAPKVRAFVDFMVELIGG